VKITDINLCDNFKHRLLSTGDIDGQQGAVCAFSGTNMVGHGLDLHRLGSELRCLSRHDSTLAHTNTLHFNRSGHQSMASLLLILPTNTRRPFSASLRIEKTDEIAISQREVFKG